MARHPLEHNLLSDDRKSSSELAPAKVDGLSSRKREFLTLVERVSNCRICPRMDGRARVLSLANGDLVATILFVAEAPGRLGAEVSGIPLFGDQTGRNFQALLDYSGIERKDVFVTNAVLCNPQNLNRTNGTPTKKEISQCSSHLKATLEIIQPEIVVALGNVALNALKAVEVHQATLAKDVGDMIAWYGRVLIPLYHPGPRARIHRPLELQRQDFDHIASLICR